MPDSCKKSRVLLNSLRRGDFLKKGLETSDYHRSILQGIWGDLKRLRMFMKKNFLVEKEQFVFCRRMQLEENVVLLKLVIEKVKRMGG